ncbi:MAG: molybdopterin-guanine dinucleotide biosynthesis protein B [Methanobacteriota archaeon]|nr:MAG: molybdopterin-guanine dinucleotide biosynthesis protein B [Euryarchaeota archaeon]
MIIGVYGYQDSGKTTFSENLIRELVRRGFSISSIKHSPHTIEVDEKSKDTWRLSEAGSNPVVLEAAGGTVLIGRPRLDFERIVELVQREFCPDVVIVEGHKEGDFPKIALGDVELTHGTVLVNPEFEDALSFIEEELAHEKMLDRLPRLDCGKCGFTCETFAREIIASGRSLDDCPERPSREVDIVIDGNRLPVGAFVAEIAEKTIRGFLSSLKGYSKIGDVEIRIRSPPDDTISEDIDR